MLRNQITAILTGHLGDYATDLRTVMVAPRVVNGFPKTLHFGGKIPNPILLDVNRESRYGLLGSPLTVTLHDTDGPTIFHLHPVNDTVILLRLGFLRTRSLHNFEKIAGPFARIHKLAIPWTSTGFSPAHVAFMPSMFRSLETLTLLGLNTNLHEVARQGHQYAMNPIAKDFRHYDEMVLRKERLQKTFHDHGRDIDVQLKIFDVPPPPVQNRRRHRR
jgi:hypothetical protein